MILSKKHKFVFIKGRKVASTSIEVFLSSICGEEDIITPITPIDEKLRVQLDYRPAQNYGAPREESDSYFTKLLNLPEASLGQIKPPKGDYMNHMSLTQVIDTYGETPEDWLILGVERCPYRKIISLANQQLNFESYKTSGKPMISDPQELKKQIDLLIQHNYTHVVKNIDLYRRADNSMNVRLLRYENIEEDIKTLMHELNITAYPPLPHLKQGLSGQDIAIDDIFTKQQLQKINEVFHDEFETFGYQMHA